MARIPEAELERLKREVRIEDLLRARGVELKRVGKDLRCRCPLHGPDEDPSFSLDPVRNGYHCFGCDAKGSVVDLVMALEGVTFRHAVEILRAGFPLTDNQQPTASNSTDRPPPRKSTTLKLPALTVEQEASDAELRRLVADYYHETLKRSPEALEYLASRGLDPDVVVDRFHLGFSNRTLGYHLPQRSRKEGAAIRGRLAELGIIKETGHELLRGSLTVPLFDAAGRVVQMYGRKITPNLRAGTPKHLYLPGRQRGIFNPDALRESREVILCEALIDALTFVSAGYGNATTAYGVNGFTEEMLEAFKSYGTERVLIAYDRDDRGEAAAAELAKRLGGEGIACFRVLFPRGMDANEYARKVTPATQSLGVALRAAQHDAGPLRSLSAVGSWLSESERDRRSDTPPRPGGVTGHDGQPPEKPTNPSVVNKPEETSSLAAATDDQVAVKTEEIAASAATPIAKPATPAAAAQPPAAGAPPKRPDGPPPIPAPTTDNQQPTTTPPSASSPVAPPPLAAEVEAEVSEHEVVIVLEGRRWRVRGLRRNLSYETLKVNLMVACGERFHVDTLDLYSSRQRGSFVKQAVSELQVKTDVVKEDLKKVLVKLEALQAAAIAKRLEPEEETAVELTSEEQAAALELLKAPDLLDRISAAFEACGLVGEHTNKLVAYLAAVSRKLEKPLAVMVQSSSAAGKSALMEAVLAFVPDEERVQYSAMTGQSLFYMGETDLKHKVLAIAEEEGAERASYALKLLQSEGKLSIASAGKDPSTGMLVTHEYKVEGPSAILLTTTAIELDEELLNRCVVLAVDESREQTRAIHRLQREAQTLEGLERRFAKQDTVKLQQNAQRLLKPLCVVNPYGRRLTFLDETTRRRRDHEKYLGMIESLALLHQYQRQVRTGVIRGRRVDYVEVTLADIDVANRLASEALGQTLDELPPQTRRFLEMLRDLVAARCEAEEVEQSWVRFSRREILDHTRWSYSQVRKHVDRLVDHEYLLTHRGSRGQSFVYELLWRGEGRQGEPFVMGLVPVEELAKPDGTTSGLTPSDGDLTPRLTPRCPLVVPRLTPEVSEVDKEEEADSEGFHSRRTSKGSLPKSSSYSSEEPESPSYPKDPGDSEDQEPSEHPDSEDQDNSEEPPAAALKLVGGR